jgi:hypothetical protein
MLQRLWQTRLLHEVAIGENRLATISGIGIRLTAAGFIPAVGDEHA